GAGPGDREGALLREDEVEQVREVGEGREPRGGRDVGAGDDPLARDPLAGPGTRRPVPEGTVALDVRPAADTQHARREVALADRPRRDPRPDVQVECDAVLDTRDVHRP